MVRLHPNLNADISEKLKSTWYYTRPKMLLLREDVGPITDEEFLELVRNRTLVEDSDVRSPELTGDEWRGLEKSVIASVGEIVKQRNAELGRLAVILDRRKEVERENRLRVRKLIRAAISDGLLTSSEKSQIEDFSRRAKIDPVEIAEILRVESQQLVEQIIEESLDDGILEPDEERKIVKHAKGLGVSLEFDENQKRKIELSKFAWQLNHSTPSDIPEIPVDFAIDNNENCISRASFEWNEIVQLKRPKGIPLGDDRYLKVIGVGNCFLTDKHLLLVTPYESKRARLSSVGRVSKHSDGIFINRSTGKSLFLRYANAELENQRFALMLDWIVTGVVQAVFIEQPFVPEIVEPASDIDTLLSISDYREPRFTFRVVGDHIDDRSYLISRLSIASQLFLVREPDNPYDENAVMVLGEQMDMLGYLKRDVAEWFGPRMDSGTTVEAEVHRIRSDGALIVGVYE